MKYRYLFLMLSTVVGFSGCYTRFASFEDPGMYTSTELDSLSDTSGIVKQVDTIIYKDNETCVWERDLYGRPYLHCYPSYYPRDWFFYNKSPWWFRNSTYWYDYKRCPRYYYYDPSCGCCKYFKFLPDRPVWRDHGRGYLGPGYQGGGRPGKPHHDNNPNPPSSSPSAPARSGKNRTGVSGGSIIRNSNNTENAAQKKSAVTPDAQHNNSTVNTPAPDSSSVEQRPRSKRNARW